MLRSIKAIPLIGLTPNQIRSGEPRFGWVNPTDLLVEGEYQRCLSKRSISLIRHVAANFDWLHVKPPVCARGASGKLCVVDGQHTAIAAASRGLKKIPVMIIEAKEIGARAKAFVAHNTDRLNVTPVQLFWSRLAAGDAGVKAAVSVCGDAGVIPVRAQPGNGRWQVGETIAFSAIERLVKRHKRDDAIRVLKTLVAAKRAPVQTHEILAVDAVLYNEEIGYDGPVFDLVTVIRSKSADEWARQVKKRAHDETGAVRLWLELARAWARAARRENA